MMTVRELLLEAYELIGDPTHWCQGVYARNAEGKSVRENAADATQWCAVGALARCRLGESPVFTALRLLEQCAAHAYDCGSVTYVNDVKGHDAVLRVFELAIIKAAAQEAEQKAANKAKKAEHDAN